MPAEKPELSRTEWIVMNLCWEQGKATARQIYEETLAQKSWNYQTVKTMLDRLVAKGYLKCEKLGPLCLFEPAVPRASVVKRSIDNFWDTVLGNTLAPMFAHLAKGRKLSKEELTSLKLLIEENEAEQAREEKHERRR
jgi:BlaI family transcriptional regulator, penicillinase repressor